MLNKHISDSIRSYFNTFSREYIQNSDPDVTDFNPETATDTEVIALNNRLADKYKDFLKQLEDRLRIKKRIPEDSDALTAFKQAAAEAGKAINKRYCLLAPKKQSPSELEIAVYGNAFRTSTKEPTDENAEKKRGRKKTPPLVMNTDIMEEYFRKSALNHMSDNELYFLTVLGHPQIEKMLSNPEFSWENVPYDVRYDTANALKFFSTDEAFYAYIKISPPQKHEAVEYLINTILHPLYPIQQELGTALMALLDLTEDDETLSKQCGTRILNQIEQQLQNVSEYLGLKPEQTTYQWSFTEKGADGKVFWLDRDR